MIYRERIRTWKSQSITILATAAQAMGNAELLQQVGRSCDELLSMVLHTSEAYDLADRPDDVHSEPERPKMTDSQILELLDKKLDHG